MNLIYSQILCNNAIKMTSKLQFTQNQVHFPIFYRDREDEIKRLSDKNRNQAEESEKALAKFKAQVDKNQTRMFDEMKQQMSRVEADLNKSKQVREKQAKEFNKQIDEEKSRHEREVYTLYFNQSAID